MLAAAGVVSSKASTVGSNSSMLALFDYDGRYLFNYLIGAANTYVHNPRHFEIVSENGQTAAYIL